MGSVSRSLIIDFYRNGVRKEVSCHQYLLKWGPHRGLLSSIFIEMGSVLRLPVIDIFRNGVRKEVSYQLIIIIKVPSHDRKNCHNDIIFLYEKISMRR